MTEATERGEAAERRAMLGMAAAGTFLGLAATGLGLLLTWAMPVVSVIVLLGCGMVGGVFGAVVGLTLHQASAPASLSRRRITGCGPGPGRPAEARRPV
jgi:hypothetical protein